MPSIHSKTSPTPTTAESRRAKAPFARPELTTPWQKFTRNLFVRVAGVVVLVGGTGYLTYTAVATSY